MDYWVSILLTLKTWEQLCKTHSRRSLKMVFRKSSSNGFKDDKSAWTQWKILWERVTCISEKDGGIKHRFMNMYKHTIRRLSVELLLNNLPAPVPLTLGYHSNHSSHMQSLFSFISCELMSYIPYLLLANFQLYMSNSTNVRAKFTLFLDRPSYVYLSDLWTEYIHIDNKYK